MRPYPLILPLTLAAAGWCATAADVAVTVQTGQRGAPPTQFGVFFEDINYGGDGGLYPERVKNRSFEFADPMMGWKRVLSVGGSGSATVLKDRPLNEANPSYLRLSASNPEASFGLENEGFFGMGVEAGATYTVSLYARVSEPTGAPKVQVELVSATGEPIGRVSFSRFTRDWKQHQQRLKPGVTDPKARLRLLVSGSGSVDLDLVSLYPRDTFKGRRNGLRPDLAQLLADLDPQFMRFPGGCIVEGRDLSKRYQWKTTVGEVASRRLIVNRWNDEFKHRPAPDYYQSFGLGFFEYFQLCEDLKASPLPILNCGMACQFNTGELVPMDQLDPYIQDALDLIEFANGPVSTPWGAKRAAMGHPKPFGMRLLGVGNEQWGPQYVERYAAFAKVLKQRHPEVQLISSAGPRPEDDLFHFLWPKLRELKADIVDEHCYAQPEWFFKNAARYDQYDRNGPKVFMGEYAAQSVQTVSPNNRNNWECALAEAAYNTGLERNGEVVTMASYAPLFGHVEGWQWTPNLIWFDNLRSYGTPNYYVVQLFGVHRGTHLLPVNTALGGSVAMDRGVYSSASYDQRSREVILKVVNAQVTSQEVDFNLQGAAVGPGNGRVIELYSDDLKAENSLEQPKRVAPTSRPHRFEASEFRYPLKPQSMTVLRVPVQ